MSKTNRGIFRSFVGGHSDRPAPEALRAYAPTSVTATAPLMTPTVRGLRFPRSHRSWPYRCARRSASLATRCARRSAPRATGSAGRSASSIARSASCTALGWTRLLNGRGAPGSGIPENGLLIFHTPPQKFWLQLASRRKKPSKDRENGGRAARPPRILHPIHYFPITWRPETESASALGARGVGRKPGRGRAICN
jgi:hypothetical protein